MEIKPEYTVLFNSISETIDQLGKIIFMANNSLELLKKAQQNTEEIFLTEADADSEVETDNIELAETN